MRVLGIEIRRAGRAERSVSGATVTQSSDDFFGAMGFEAFASAADIVVTVDNALGVPAICGAVNFLAGTIAGLPLDLYRRAEGGKREQVDRADPIARILHDIPNDEMSSFEWRKYKFEQVLTGGRGLTFIERDKSGKVMNLWPLEASRTRIRRVNEKKIYEYRPSGGKGVVIYQQNEVIDIPFMLKEDRLGHRGPIMMNRDVVALAIAATNFGSRFFQNGGVPPFAVTGGFQSGRSMQSAAADIETAVRSAAKQRRQALVLPTGLEIKPLGTDAQKSQLLELKRFLIEEFARIYSIPPTFLQDLTHGTFSNTEQQDLHFVKHTLKRWVEAFEQEVNLKLFGREKPEFFVEMNMDGLLRGDFKARMEGYALGVQHAILKPNEVRQMENRPSEPGGDQLMIQGATVPLGSQGAGVGTAGAGNGA